METRKAGSSEDLFENYWQATFREVGEFQEIIAKAKWEEELGKAMKGGKCTAFKEATEMQ